MQERTPKANIPVVILCGGQGTRLREETERIPKPLVDIGGRPILWHLMKLYGHYGLGRFILALGYKGWQIKEYVLRYREHLTDFTVRLKEEHAPEFHNDLGVEDWEITCAETGSATLTGARIRRVRDYIHTPTFMLTYGDGLADIDLDRLLDFHYEQGRIGTVTGIHPTSRYGEIRVEGQRVVEFNEKPTAPGGWVSGGFFVFQREFFDYLNDDPGLVFEWEPLRQLARDGQLSVFPHKGFWMGMDTYREYLLLNELWQTHKAPWKLWSDLEDDPSHDEAGLSADGLSEARSRTPWGRGE